MTLLLDFFRGMNVCLISCFFVREFPQKTLGMGPIPKAAEQRQMNALKQGLGLGAPKVHCWKLSCISNDMGEHDVSRFFWTFSQKERRNV